MYSTGSRQKWPTFKSGPLMFPIGTAFVGTVVKSLRGMPLRMSIWPGDKATSRVTYSTAILLKHKVKMKYLCVLCTIMSYSEL